jgi:hypothetical protein
MPLRRLRTPAIISFLLVLPFMLLELINKPGSLQDFPITLFGLLWLLSLLFILIGTPVVRSVAAGSGSWVHRLSLTQIPRIIVLIPIAWLWVVLVVDQMPCFLGVPNCD